MTVNITRAPYKKFKKRP